MEISTLLLITVNDPDHITICYKRSTFVIYWLYKRFAIVAKKPQENPHENHISCLERISA